MADLQGTLCDEHFVRRLLSELEAGRSFVLSTIFATKGSMPRHAGARMVHFEDGSFLGTIGGGSVELIAQERSKRFFTGEENNQIEWMTREKTGMACGGDALVGIRKVTPDQKDFFAKDLMNLIDAKKPFVVDRKSVV